MMRQLWLWMFLISCILASSFAVNGLHSPPIHGIHFLVETVRQCSCKEVQQCFHSVWGELKCTYRNGYSPIHRVEGKGLEFLDKCSAKKIQNSCSNEENKDIPINDFKYVQTKYLENPDDQLCFNQNMIKCFEKFSCDIVYHNIVLKNIYNECSKEFVKYTIESMTKHPEMTAADIEKVKMEYVEKYNETFVDDEI
uniref:Uncharacterized protein n=1 Tax=Panagrolaimus davidi TaxID=227884 RepID=A0A914QV67_9BILA